MAPPLGKVLGLPRQWDHSLGISHAPSGMPIETPEDSAQSIHSILSILSIKSSVMKKTEETNKTAALKKAVIDARAALKDADVPARCRRQGIDAIQDGILSLRMFGQDMRFDTRSLTLSISGSDEPAKDGDLVLLLHFLGNDFPVRRTGELITFRDFSGGQFYYQPFLARSSQILLKRFGDDAGSLKSNLARLDWEPLASGDVGAFIHAFGPLYGAIVFREGDEEFPATADFLFDSGVKRALRAEDAAVIATRICLALM